MDKSKGNFRNGRKPALGAYSHLSRSCARLLYDTKRARGALTCHSRQLSPYPEKCQLSYRYLARASVGRKISDGGGRGTVGCRREWQGAIRPRRLAMLWLWKVFGDVISFGSGQIAKAPCFNPGGEEAAALPLGPLRWAAAFHPEPGSPSSVDPCGCCFLID